MTATAPTDLDELDARVVIQALAQVLDQKRKLPDIPAHCSLANQLWSPEDVAGFLRVRPRTVVDKIQFRDGFPKPVRIPSDNRGHLRWWAQEVVTWMRQYG